IEVVGSRIAGWDITILDTIADNASSGMFVLGATPVSPSRMDLADAAMTMTVNGNLASHGTGAACLGHPYNAALWLVRRMVADGLRRATLMEVPTTATGVDGLLTRPDFDEIGLVMDATSASAHRDHWAKLQPRGVRMLDLTPAALGPYCVPVVNLDDHLDAPD